MQIPDYYQILEIERDATAREIQGAFRKLAKRYHPDKNPERTAFAEKMFREICNAYNTLHDKKQKSDYDQTLQTIERQQSFQNGFASGTLQHTAYFDRLNRLDQNYAKLELLLHALLHPKLRNRSFYV